MKKKVLSCILLLFSFSAFAQEKATLTKEETINYIQKKISEVENYNTKDGSERYYFNTISLNECRLKISFKEFGSSDYDTWCGGQYTPPCPEMSQSQSKKIISYEFDINKTEEIIETTTENKNSNIGFIKIVLNSNSASKNISFNKLVSERRYCDLTNQYLNSCIEKFESKTELTSYILIPYYKTDVSNFNKLKKAFEHLSALCKAEDDPFGN